MAADFQNVYRCNVCLSSSVVLVDVSEHNCNPAGEKELRTFALIVSAHPYCARKFTCHVMHRARALSAKMSNDREDGHCYSFAWI